MTASYLPPAPAPETPMALLSTAELFLITCLWLRAAAWPEGAEQDACWRAGFAAAGIAPQGAAAFDTFFRILRAASPQALPARCPRCPGLGRDEVLLLRLIGLLQRGEDEGAAEILADWLCPTAARMAMLPARGLAAALAASRLILPRRHPDAADSSLIAPGGYVDPGLGLVH